MNSTNLHEQMILKFSPGEYLGIADESFIIDRQAAGLYRYPLKFYRQFFDPFITYCNVNALTHIQPISAEYLGRYLPAFPETHNPGGVHDAYRSLRAFFRWLMNEEIMAPEWKNPMQKVKPPKVPVEPVEPIPSKRTSTNQHL